LSPHAGHHERRQRREHAQRSGEQLSHHRHGTPRIPPDRLRAAVARHGLAAPATLLLEPDQRIRCPRPTCVHSRGRAQLAPPRAQLHDYGRVPQSPGLYLAGRRGTRRHAALGADRADARLLLNARAFTARSRRPRATSRRRDRLARRPTAWWTWARAAQTRRSPRTASGRRKRDHSAIPRTYRRWHTTPPRSTLDAPGAPTSPDRRAGRPPRHRTRSAA